MPGKINSVLARFEQTIQENESAGGGGGMYLSNVAASKKKPVRLSSRSLDGGSAAAAAGSRTRDMSVSAGSYRNFLQADAGGGGMAARGKPLPHEARCDSTVSTAGMTDKDWDPFVETDKDWDPFASIDEKGGDQSESEFSEQSEDEEEDGRRAARGSSHRRLNRPSASKRVGRLGNRKTRTSRSDPRARTRRTNGQTKEEEDVEEEEEEESEASTNNQDEDEGDDDRSAHNYPTGRPSRESSRRGTRPIEAKDGEQHHRSTNSSAAPRRQHGSGTHHSRSTARKPVRR